MSERREPGIPASRERGPSGPERSDESGKASARTRVGIVEWARRIDRARRTEGWLAETSAARVAAEPGAAGKVNLVRAARLHAWHADLWKNVAPLLHDVSPDEVAATESVADASPDSVREQLDHDYTAWESEAGPVAEAPILRVLHLVARDHDDHAAR